MVKKKTIGKIQLIIGIIILIVGIVGLTYSYTAFNETLEKSVDFSPLTFDNESYTNDTKEILSANYINTMYSAYSTALSITINIMLFFGIIIILSLLFIFQGLVNISEQKLKQKEIII